MPKVSIIVPIYNSEEYLNQCLDSIQSQTETDIEIILVDDGSTDRSLSICEQHKSCDKRIKIIHKENGGVSAARNTAIKKANGEYISFVDSDDYIDLNTMKIAYETAQETNSDLVIWNHYVVENNTTTKNRGFPFANTYRGRDNMERLQATTLCPMIKSVDAPTSTILCMGFACNKIFKTALIKANSIYFDEQVSLYEDVLFTCEYLSKANSVTFVDKPLYYYRKVAGGATLRYKPKIQDNNEALINAINEKMPIMTPVQKEAYYSRVIRCLSDVMKYYCFRKEYSGNRIREIRRIIRDYPEYQKAINKVNLRYITPKQKALWIMWKIL